MNLSYDGTQPEIILYWGSFDHKDNAVYGIIQSLGQRGAGVGSLFVDSFDPGQMVYYQVQAKGGAYSDWSDVSGQFRTVALPAVEIAGAVNQTTSSALLRGQVVGNGGESAVIPLSTPLVADDLIAHWRFDEGEGSKFMIQQDFHQLDRCTEEQSGLMVWAANLVLP